MADVQEAKAEGVVQGEIVFFQYNQLSQFNQSNEILELKGTNALLTA